MKIGFSLLGVYFLVIGLTGIPFWFYSDGSEGIDRLALIMLLNQFILIVSGLILLFLAKRFKQEPKDSLTSHATNINSIVKLLGIFFIVDTSSEVADGFITTVTAIFNTLVFLDLFIPPFLQLIAGFTLLFYGDVITKRFIATE